MDLFFLSVTYQIIMHVFGGLGEAFTHGPCGFVVSVLFWRHAMVAATGLFPLKIWLGNQRVRTDGYLLLQIVRGKVGQHFPESQKWMEALVLLQCDGSEGESFYDNLADLPSFAEQQARLSSQLLRPQRPL